mgnify:CR=1 FL=1
MKIEELKVGDRIKFKDSLCQISDGIIMSFRDPSLTPLFQDRVYVKTENQTYSIHISDVISKLEPTYKEIPIEHPPKSFKFELKNIQSVTIDKRLDHSTWGVPGYNGGRLTLDYQGIVFYDNFPKDLQMGKTYTVEIKEKE